MVIRKLNDLFELVRHKRLKTFIVVSANDINTLTAASKAVEENLINAVLIGDEALILPFIKKYPSIQSKIRVIDQPNDEMAASLAIEMVNRGEGDALMKGLITSDKFLKAVLNKEKGLVDTGNLLSHVAVIENKNYHKLLIAGDVAIIPLPNLHQKEIIITYLVRMAKKLGVNQPKVAVIAPTEKEIPSVVSTMDAVELKKMNLSGQIPGCIVEGPIALDVALDVGAARIKGIDNQVAGDADCLLFPNIDAGNVFYKTNTKLASSEAAAVLLGAKVPIVLTSRGDSMLTKLYSMSLAALVGINEKDTARNNRKDKQKITTH